MTRIEHQAGSDVRGTLAVTASRRPIPVTDTERFRTEWLIARSRQIKDLALAIEVWGDPAVTALIDSRGELSNAQVEEKLRAEIEHERLHGVQYWALFVYAAPFSPCRIRTCD